MIEYNIINEDCNHILPTLESQKYRLILCDLPFQMLAAKWDKQLNLESIWEQYKRLIAPDGSILFFAAQPFTTDVINSNREWFRYCWYWKKNQGTNFFHAKRMPIRKMEEIIVFYDKKPIYNPQISDGHIPTNSAKGCSNGRAYHGTNTRDYIGGKTTRYPDNILDFKCVDNYSRLHPSEKPVKLLEYFVKTYSNDGDWVLDPTSGVGSLGEACFNTGRNFTLIEKDIGFHEIAEKRIEGLLIKGKL